MIRNFFRKLATNFQNKFTFELYFLECAAASSALNANKSSIKKAKHTYVA